MCGMLLLFVKCLKYMLNRKKKPVASILLYFNYVHFTSMVSLLHNPKMHKYWDVLLGKRMHHYLLIHAESCFERVLSLQKTKTKMKKISSNKSTVIVSSRTIEALIKNNFLLSIDSCTHKYAYVSVQSDHSYADQPHAYTWAFSVLRRRMCNNPNIFHCIAR